MPVSLTYEQAIAVLQRAQRFGINPSLTGIRALTDALDRPQDAFESVQVTGTNGKSSVTRMTAALLGAQGLRVGAYTSPELVEMTERIEIDGVPVSKEAFARAIAAAQEAAATCTTASNPSEPPTEFELLTAAAFWLFRASKIDIAVLEVGMGGRWDATSIVAPAVAVITGVALDHVAHLGTTREAIAADKARIISPASVAVLGPGTVGLEAIFLTRAGEVDAPVRAVREQGTPSPLAEELTIRYRVTRTPKAPDGITCLDVQGAYGSYPSLKMSAPAYQAPNVATALAAAEAALGHALDVDVTRRALAALPLPGRFELLRADPPIIIDAAHNPQAASVLASAVLDAFPDGLPTILLGVLADKDAAGIVRALASAAARFVVTQSRSSRALGADDLADIVEAETSSRPQVCASVAEALAACAESGADPLIITGSITTAGEARDYLLESA